MTLCLYLLAALLLSHAITGTALPAGPLSETALPTRPPSRLQSPSDSVVALNPPRIHNLENGKPMDLDITSFYASKRCPFDSQLAFIFSDAGSKFSEKTLKDPTGSTHGVYNAIIDLFSVIEYVGWTDSMCEDEILKSVSTHTFCSDLSVEKLLEKENEKFLVAIEKKYPVVFTVARDLQGMNDKECAMKCGGVQASVLCKTFTLLNVFLGEKRMEQQTGPTSIQCKMKFIVHV